MFLHLAPGAWSHGLQECSVHSERASALGVRLTALSEVSCKEVERTKDYSTVHTGDKKKRAAPDIHPLMFTGKITLYFLPF